MRRRAFSLIEIMVVIAIVVMISGLVLPAIAGRLAGQRVESVMQEISALGLLARGEGCRSPTGVTLQLETGDDGVLRAGLVRWEPTDGAVPEVIFEFPAGWAAESGVLDPDSLSESRAGNEAGLGPVVLATYLSDGTVIAAREGVQVRREDRLLGISVSAGVGRITVVEIREGEEGDVEADEALDEVFEGDQDWSEGGTGDADVGARPSGPEGRP